MTTKAKPPLGLIEKLQAVRQEINSRVFEREEETDGILLAVLAGTSALFLGEVGTAKTMHIQLASSLLGLSNFDILMSETVKPDQIFGPADIPALAQGKQQTKYVGYAPDSEILFFDEIFKANATVLNPLLWLINEHKFRDGDNGVIDCPVRATFAASNEIPTDPILKALYDRLLLRYNVGYLKDENNVRKLIQSLMVKPEEVKPILTVEEVDKLRSLTKRVVLPDKLRDLAITVRRQVEMAMNYTISDRRFLKSFRLMQASAVLNGRSEIISTDLEVLANIFWNEPSQVARVQSIVYSNTSGDTALISSYLERAATLKVALTKGGNIKKTLTEIQSIFNTLKKYNSRFAKQATAEVRAIGLMGVHILSERNTFRLLKVVGDKGTIYKVSSATSMVWSVKELRMMGFRIRRRGNYWWSGLSLLNLKSRMVKINPKIKVVVATME